MSGKNHWGTSIGKAFGCEQDLSLQDDHVAYYYGEDGSRAVCDVTAGDVTLIVNGEAVTLPSGKGAVRLCEEKCIDLYSGWSPRP
jgi:hypothetical protein